MIERAGLGPAIVWLRDDLRLDDNPALLAARDASEHLLVVYIFDERSEGLRALGGAARWWLHHSLASLAASLDRAGARLDICHGDARKILVNLAIASGAAAVHWNRCYSAAEIARDRKIKSALKDNCTEVESHNGHLLREPWTVTPKSGGYFKVYSPFWRAEQALGELPAPQGAPRKLASAPYPAEGPTRTSLEKLGLLPTNPDWAGGLRDQWQPGEDGAHKLLHAFVDSGLKGYASERDFPGKPSTSRLSPHLRFGEISARRVFHAAADAAGAHGAKPKDVSKFHAELAWRDFSYNLLFNWPDLPARNFQAKFDKFPWQMPNPSVLKAWQRGRTGYPIVDAGMRELWHTGYMHNRVRLIVGSFLVKHLLIDWRVGEAWFWDTLCDADLANNTANWQWVAGCGADAAPYFRIFNPILQGKKFDLEGDYVRQHVPELDKLDAKWIHEPWLAPNAHLEKAGIVLGKTYPSPIVAHAEARARALEAFAHVKDYS